MEGKYAENGKKQVTEKGKGIKNRKQEEVRVTEEGKTKNEK